MKKKKLIFNYGKLRCRITEKFGSQKAFASAIDLSEKSISEKLSNKKYWTQPEIVNAVQALCLNDEDVKVYFFDRIVQEN